MSLYELKKQMTLAKKIQAIKDLEFIIAQAKYDLYLAEIEYKKTLSEYEKEQNNGTN